MESNDAPPKRGSTPLATIFICVRLVIQSNVALRAVPRVLAILYPTMGPRTVIPEASSVRWWLLRLGLYALQQSLVKASDWVFIIDHSMQIGTVKVCLILGVRLQDLPYPRRALRFEDMCVIALIPVETSTGEIVAAQLEQAALRTGIPRQIVSDGGSDVKKGAEIFTANHPQTIATYDAAHYGAIVLKRAFEKDANWSDYIARLGQVKTKIQQTLDAFLLAPSLRPKARYMNLEKLLKWSRQILKLVDRGSAGGRASQRAAVRYGWLAEYRESIERWSRWELTVRHSVAFVRRHGLGRGRTAELLAQLKQLTVNSCDARMALTMLRYVRDASHNANFQESLVGSSEVLESVFGKWKAIEHQESKSGITSLVLSLGVMIGSWPIHRIQAGLEVTPVKSVINWCKRLLPQSLQSQRQQSIAELKA